MLTVLLVVAAVVVFATGFSRLENRTLDIILLVVSVILAVAGWTEGSGTWDYVRAAVFTLLALVLARKLIRSRGSDEAAAGAESDPSVRA